MINVVVKLTNLQSMYNSPNCIQQESIDTWEQLEESVQNELNYIVLQSNSINLLMLHFIVQQRFRWLFKSELSLKVVRRFVFIYLHLVLIVDIDIYWPVA